MSAITFLFTDIEGSTRLWEAHAPDMRFALARHDALVREAIARAQGHVFKTGGDAFCAVFPSAGQAVSCALAAQIALAGEPWPAATPILVRMALHTGDAERRDGDYFGPTVNRVARLLAAAHGGQTLLSQATHDHVAGAPPLLASLRDLGAHRLKDLARPERVFELVHPGLRGDFSPIRSLSTHPNNLPGQTTTFIGRDGDVARVATLLTKARLLALTGPGGVGKSRLALHVASETLARFADGAWLVELAPIGDAALVPNAVAHVLGVAERAGESVTRTLVAHLRDRSLLLLLDNCEHLVDAAASLADALLRECPHVRIVATTREALRLPGEQRYAVQPLPLPVDARAQKREMVAQCESVQLFLDRLRQVRADYELTDRDAATAASICTRLDGMPLAIELAAARAQALSLVEIDRGLTHRFRLLSQGARTAMPHHRTLRALIDWSFDLLDPSERQLLATLSLFAAGFTLTAVEAVAEDACTPDLVASLCGKSLVIRHESDGVSRFRLLETVRQYAGERLASSGRDAEIRKRHRDYYAKLVELAVLELDGPEQAQRLSELDEAHDNIRAALEHCLAHCDATLGLRMCGALHRFWMVRGHYSEGRRWCARMLASEGADAQSPERAAALYTLGLLAHEQGDYANAKVAYEESLSIWALLGDAAGMQRIRNNLANIANERGDYATSRSLHEANLAEARRRGELRDVAYALGGLGVVLVNQKDYSAARPLYEESLAIWRRLEDRRAISSLLNGLGYLAFAQGEYANARALLEESLAIRRDLGNPRGVTLTLVNLAELEREEGDIARARALIGESLTIAHGIGAERVLVDSLEFLAGLDARAGRPQGAALAWGAAAKLCESVGLEVPDDLRQEMAAARAACADGTAFDRAWQTGHTLALDRVIELVVDGAA